MCKQFTDLVPSWHKVSYHDISNRSAVNIKGVYILDCAIDETEWLKHYFNSLEDEYGIVFYRMLTSTQVTPTYRKLSTADLGQQDVYDMFLDSTFGISFPCSAAPIVFPVIPNWINLVMNSIKTYMANREIISDEYAHKACDNITSLTSMLLASVIAELRIANHDTTKWLGIKSMSDAIFLCNDVAGNTNMSKDILNKGIDILTKTVNKFVITHIDMGDNTIYIDKNTTDDNVYIDSAFLSTTCSLSAKETRTLLRHDQLCAVAVANNVTRCDSGIYVPTELIRWISIIWKLFDVIYKMEHPSTHIDFENIDTAVQTPVLGLDVWPYSTHSITRKECIRRTDQ